MIVRPYGVVIDGDLELGLELEVEEGRIVALRPHTGIPEPYVVSPAFVNAHSHFEYLGLEGRVTGDDYWSWIRELTRMKADQNPDDVRADALRAGALNRATGVAWVAEHSDRPGSGEAMAATGLDGVIFQEVITLREYADPGQKLEQVLERAARNREAFGGPVYANPHAHHTVAPEPLRALGGSGHPLSIHVAETEHESQFTRYGEGPIADFYRLANLPVRPSGMSVVGTLALLGCVRKGVQFVHCCAIEDGDLELMAEGGVTVAHCPRSNRRLECPAAPVREMLDAGIPVGLGLDSAASSGPIDMFAEMREALATSHARGRPVSPQEVWRMATERGRESVPVPGEPWRIEPCSAVPLIAIQVPGASSVADLIAHGAPEQVAWL
ncbi:MAG: amidohydrolase family protein [Fimbriimonadaceae bacterium]|nr:amidohydrolase family protein [Fimbriimonadaceae bacterium]